MKKILIAFLSGSLVTAGTLGTLGYLKYNDMRAENNRLEMVVKKQDWRLSNLSKNQVSLEAELTNLKENKELAYDQTIGALMQAKENASIEALYEIGVKALAEKDAPRAYFALAQVIKANPKYKDIAEHYPKSQQAYGKHQQSLFDAELKETYLKAFDQQANKQYAQAKVNYQRVLEMKPDFKDAKARLATVSRQLNLRDQTRDLDQKNQWLAATYKLGFNHQANGRYAQAVVAYEQIVNDSPNYKDSAKRLEAVRSKLPRVPVPPQSQAPSTDQKLCYEIGVTFGRCSKNMTGEGCSQLSQPAACKGSPEFVKGFQTTGAVDPNTLLKGLSSFLTDMNGNQTPE